MKLKIKTELNIDGGKDKRWSVKKYGSDNKHEGVNKDGRENEK